MEISTNNTTNFTPQQPQSGIVNNTTSDNSGQHHMSNDNLQSQSAKPPPTTTHVKTNNKLASSFNSNNLKPDSDLPDDKVILNNKTNGDHSMAKNLNKLDQADCAGSEIQQSDMNQQTRIPDVDEVLNKILDRVVAENDAPDGKDTPSSDENNTANVSQSSLCIPDGNGSQTKTSLITPVADDEVEISKTKDFITLRNIEITPRAQPLPSAKQTELETDIDMKGDSKRKQGSKRTHSEASKSDEDPSNGRSKRQRKQTELFQADTVPKPSRLSNQSEKATTVYKRTSSSSSSSSRSSSAQPKPKQHKEPKVTQPITQPQNPPQHQMNSHDIHDVIFYEKNDYLAIRNEENTFYLCQLTENVRIQRPFIKVKWLDTKDDGKTYFLTSHYDKVPQKSIIMPVILNKLKGEKKGAQLFSLDDQHKENIMDRLRRSLNVPTESE